jgi:hypothetical protein
MDVGEEYAGQLSDGSDVCFKCVGGEKTKMGRIITKQWLHQIEMELARLCDSGEITREDVINRFTNLIYNAPDENGN